MNIQPPEGYLVQKIKAVPPEVRVGIGKGIRFAWLRELALEMKPGNGALQITTPSKKDADAARGSLTQLSRRFGPTLEPARKWEVWCKPGLNGAYEVYVECFWLASDDAGEGGSGQNAGQNGHGEGEEGKESRFVTYTSVSGKVYSYREIKALLRDKRVVAGERFVNSQRGPMMVIERGGELLLRRVSE